jgi:hypothetical protein
MRRSVRRSFVATLVAVLSVALTGQAAVPAPAAAATVITAFYVAGGAHAMYEPTYLTAATAAWTSSYQPDSGSGGDTGLATFDIVPSVPGESTWQLRLAAPPGEQLEVGTYDAVRWPFQGPGQAGIDLSPGGCSTAGGSITVKEIVLAGTTITKFAASFVYDCENQGVLTRGEIRLASGVGMRALDAAAMHDWDAWPAVTGQSATRSVAITARGSLSTTISGATLISPVGGPVTDFAISGDTCTGVTLNAGASCAVSVTFTPSMTGHVMVYLEIANDTVATTFRIFLNASGVPYLLEPRTLDFGPHQLQTTALKTIKVINGLDPLSVGTPGLVGDSAFSVAPDSGCVDTTIPSLGTCTLTVQFKPTSIGTVHADLSFGPDATTSITGTGMTTSKVAWGTDRTVGRNYTWTSSNGLGRSVNGATTYLHVVQATDYVGEKFATDSGPYAGVYYVRTANEGSSWSTSFRLNPATQHAARSALTASGSTVYVAWVSQTKWVKYSPTAPRVLYVRVNTNFGSSTAWASTVRLTSTSGRVDVPVIAANGHTAYVVFTDSVTGSIRLATTKDRGVTWTTTTIGSTTRSTPDGKSGLPSIALRGTQGIVAWSADGAYKVQARATTDGGATWSPTATIATTAEGWASVAAGSDRVAAAWPGTDGIRVRTRKAGAWGTTRKVPPPGVGPYGFHDTPALALNGTSGTAVAWSACATQCDGNTPLIDLVWAESRDGGATFPHRQVLVSSPGPDQNWSPSVIWALADKRHVLYERDTEVGYRLRMRTGTGAPQ